MTLALSVGTSIASKNALFGDGGLWVLEMLTQDKFMDFDWPRRFVNYLTQAPMVFGMRLGVREVSKLVYLLSFGQVFVPSFFWFLGLVKLRNHPLLWPFVAVCAVCYLNVSFLTVGEFNTAYGVSAYLVTLLISEERLSKLELLALAFCSTVCVLSYESMSFLAPLLLCLVVLRFRRSSVRTERVVFGVCALNCVLAFAVAVWSITHPRDPSNLARAVKFSLLFGPGQFELSVLCLGTYFIYVTARNRWVSLVSSVISLGLAFVLFAPAFWADPGQHHRMRIVSGAVLFLSSSLFAFLVGKQMKVGELRYYGIPVLLFLSLSLSKYKTAKDFELFLSDLRHQLNSRTGVLNFFETDLEKKFGYYWALPSLSIVLRKDASRAIMSAPLPPGSWRPFDPEKDPPVIPDKFETLEP